MKYMVASMFFLLSFSAHSSTLNVETRCDSCVSSNDYRIAAESALNNKRPGQYSVLVANLASIDIYEVSALITREDIFPGQFINFVTIESVNRLEQSIISQVVTLNDAVSDVIFVDASGNTFVDEQCPSPVDPCVAINALLNGLPETQLFRLFDGSRSLLRRLWDSFFGDDDLQYLVLFPDGSLQAYEVTNLGFNIIDGTMVNPDGTIPPDGGGGFEDMGFNGGGEQIPTAGGGGGSLGGCSLILVTVAIRGDTIESVTVECLD